MAWRVNVVTMRRTFKCMNLSSSGIEINLFKLANLSNFLPQCLSTLLILLGVLAQMTGEAISFGAASAATGKATPQAISSHQHQVGHLWLPKSIFLNFCCLFKINFLLEPNFRWSLVWLCYTNVSHLVNNFCAFHIMVPGHNIPYSWQHYLLSDSN